MTYRYLIRDLIVLSDNTAFRYKLSFQMIKDHLTFARQLQISSIHLMNYVILDLKNCF